MRANERASHRVPTAPSQAPLSGTLRRAVRRQILVSAGVIATGLVGAPAAIGAPFPPVLPLGSLFPAGGGDGSRGFVLAGVRPNDQAGRLVSAAGDVNGDGIDDVLVSAGLASPGGRTFA